MFLFSPRETLLMCHRNMVKTGCNYTSTNLHLAYFLGFLSFFGASELSTSFQFWHDVTQFSSSLTPDKNHGARGTGRGLTATTLLKSCNHDGN